MRFLHMNRWGTSIDDGQLHDIASATRERATDGTDTLTVVTSSDVQQGDVIAYRDAQGLWREHTVTVVETIHDADGRPYSSVTAHTILEELTLKGITAYKKKTGAMDMLRTALADTRFTAGRVESNGVATATLDIKQTNALDMLQQIANLFDLEIEETCRPNADRTAIASRTVNLVARTGDTNGRRIEWGRDLKGLRTATNSRRPVTRLHVYGSTKSTEKGEEQVTIAPVNGGRDYIDVSDPTLLRLYGRPGPDGSPLPSEAYITYDSDDPATLLRLGKGQLTKWSTPTVTYELDSIQLANAGTGMQGIGVGDTIHVIDAMFPTPLRLEARVLKTEENLLDSAAATRITFGNVTPTMTRQNRLAQNTVQRLWSSSGAWDDAANRTDGYLNGVIAGLNRLMNETGGYTYMDPGEGITVYDRPRRADGTDRDATMAIQLGGGYFRIANSRKSDGTWNWRTMGTGGGLVADTLVAGTITGGRNTWNLETGDLQFSEGVIHDAANRSRWDLSADTFTTDHMTANHMKATNMTVNGMTASDVTATNMKATNMTVNGMTASDVTATNMKATNMTVNGMTANNVKAYGMTASNVTANGTFRCGNPDSGHGIELSIDGHMNGYYRGERVGYIDYSAEVYNVENPSEHWNGMQLQSNGIIRMMTPRLSVAATGDTSVTSQQTFTGTVTQPVVTSIKRGPNNTLSTWYYGDLKLNFVNGLLVSYSTIAKG